MSTTFAKKIAACALGGLMAMGIVGIASKIDEAPIETKAASYAFDEKNIELTFASLSDPHIGYGSNDQVLSNAFTVLKSFSQRPIDAVYFHGDQTQNGTAAEVETFKSVINQHFDPTKTPIITTNGNHDTYWSGCMTTSQFVNAYGSEMYTFDVDKEIITTGNRHVKVGDYHFLSVQIQTFMPNINNMSAQTKTWLKNTLDSIVAEDPNSYVFVSCHSPAKNTVYGSMDTDNYGEWGSSQELDDILKNYPQVLLFTGHTHCAINDDRSINQSTYTQINGGSTSDIVLDGGAEYTELGNAAIGDPRSYSQGMLVDVDKNGNVRVTRIDFKRAMQIKDCWYLDSPKENDSHLTRYSTRVRTQNNSAPVFESGASLTVKETGANALEILIPKASDDDMVLAYETSLINGAGSVLKTVKTLSPWFANPNLDTLPEEQKVTMSGVSLAYPYTVKVVALDCFGGVSDPLEVVMRDTKEEDMATAAAVDARISALAEKDAVAKSDGEEIVAIRAEINAMSYKTVGYMQEYETFVGLEAEYYGKYYLTKDAEKYEPKVEDTFTLSTASRGGVEESDYTGVTFQWISTTKNVSHGFKQTYDLDGLHISFANLSMTSENKKYAVLLSNKEKDKWTNGEALLIAVDFETGEVTVNDKTAIATSKILQYNKLGATPFDIRFTIVENGDLTLDVHSVNGEETIVIPKGNLENIPNLTDTKNCYVSLCPWNSRTTGSMDIVAIHGGESVCGQYESSKPVTQPSESEEEGGCGSSVAAASVCAVTALAGAVALAKKKKDED